MTQLPLTAGLSGSTGQPGALGVLAIVMKLVSHAENDL